MGCRASRRRLVRVRRPTGEQCCPAQTDLRGRTQITIRGALREQQLLVYPDRSLCRISVGQTTLPKTAVGGLPRMSAGWSTWKHGVVVKS